MHSRRSSIGASHLIFMECVDREEKSMKNGNVMTVVETEGFGMENKMEAIRSEIRLQMAKKKQESEALAVQENKSQVYRFDLFKGIPDASGKIQKARSVGSAYLREGLKTYTVYLKTFLKDPFYLLANPGENAGPDFSVLTREPSKNPRRKYFWHHVGEGRILGSENPGIARISFDMLGSEIYMNLYPVKVTEVEPEPVVADLALATA